MKQAAISSGFDAFVCNESVCLPLLDEDFLDDYKKVYDFMNVQTPVGVLVE